MFEELQRSWSVKGRDFLLSTLEVMLEGREGEGVGVGLQGGVVLLLLWSLSGGTGGLLAGKEADRVARAWELGWEEAFETSLIGTGEVSYWALPPSLHQHILKYTHKASLHIQANKHTHGFTHTCVHLYPVNTFTLTDFDFLFICGSVRWALALIGPGGDWQGMWINREARFSRDKQQEGEWQEGPLLHKQRQTHNGIGKIN